MCLTRNYAIWCLVLLFCFAIIVVGSSTQSNAQSSNSQQVRTSSGITAAQIIKKVDPEYPTLAKAAHISGDVVLEGDITANGDIANLQVLSGPPLLRNAALIAVQQWKYSPYRFNGIPISMHTSITVTFTAPNEQAATPAPLPSQTQQLSDSTNSVSAQKMLQDGDVFYSAGRYSEAFSKYLDVSLSANNEISGIADSKIGAMYFIGRGDIYQDYAKAFAWFSKAMQQGNISAEVNLGVMYFKGLGVQQNLVKAHELFDKAFQQGEITAKYWLSEVDAQTSPQTAPVRTSTFVASNQTSQAEDDSADKRQEIADKIEDLKSDMEEHESEAKTWDNTAEEERNSGCSGPAAAICQSIGQIGVAKAQANANKERNAANEDRAEIERLQGKDVEAPRKLDSSFTGNLQQVTSQNPSVLQVGNQQAANMRAIGNANAAQQQAAASNNLAQPMYVAFSFSSLGLGGDGAWGAAIDQNEQMAIENSANRCVSTSQDSQSCGTGNGGRWPVCQADGKARWVALAINNDGKAEDWSDGEGIGYDNANGAQQAAMANCGKSGCQIVWTQFVSCTVGASALSASGQGVRNPSSGGATRSAGSTSTPSGQNQKGCVAQNEKDTIPGSQNWLACPGW
jgi:TonB family protein